MKACKNQCEKLGIAAAQAMHNARMKRPRLAALKLTVGAYATYLRFGVQMQG